MVLYTFQTSEQRTLICSESICSSSGLGKPFRVGGMLSATPHDRSAAPWAALGVSNLLCEVAFVA
jgi:hypothetical protein